jgi:poly(beta-D-mannuronate) lyase
MRDAVLIAWGALTGDSERFRLGLTGVVDAIAAMRPDGAWPLELARGERALWYQRHALASLTAAAEIAAAQGVDLWSIDIEGRSLHRAVTWLLDALDGATAGQDLGFLTRRGNGRHYMSWGDAYIARYPDHPNAKRLAALLATADRPLIDDYSGGDVARLTGGASGRPPLSS